MAGDGMSFDDKQIDKIYSLIDEDDDGSIDKKEMEVFFKAMMSMQENLKFKSSNAYVRK